ncbi:hypothetical protein RBSH_02886 [Rhodopirellula baltica SH28]|uniref:Uncharacterized protein n=2 Tax=Rhodopirellula baltica TaxID=265606 RepID=F2AQZ7_RHOBT|nr:hypothetical protein RBWH47_05674 [Rhodopirellula baltica WH47]EKK01756.1 hypothetical protein RBSH_02886 [Rhodopirellula baltica SH28]
MRLRSPSREIMGMTRPARCWVMVGCSHPENGFILHRSESLGFGVIGMFASFASADSLRVS